MSNLKEIRTSIQSVTATRKITSALKMVSAAKFHKAQETISHYKPYAKKTLEILRQILPEDGDIALSQWFKVAGGSKKAAIILFTSSSSLCGSFNQNIIKKVAEEGPGMLPALWDSGNVDFFCIGKKGLEYFSKRDFYVPFDNHEVVDKPNFSKTAALADLIIDCFLRGEYNAVYVAYNEFKNPSVQVPTISKLLPMPNSPTMEAPRGDATIYEPDKYAIATLLIPKAIKITLHSWVLESVAGEHSARMRAMHQATENATELINSLTLQYNQVRQATITKEILEIVSGAEAQKGQ